MLEVRDLVKFYGGGKRARAAKKDGDAHARVLAVDGVSFEVKPGELFTLLGPSGCGKTTTLRSIAGLERPDSGLISIADRPVFDGAAKVNVPVNRRELGMVFQSYAIWPHMTVFENTAFPLKVAPRKRRLSKAEIEKRVSKTLEVTGLHAFAARPATNLSGGQQQRLALARAMVVEPDLMLLDEPLSNLDAKLRDSMRMELQRLQGELGLTSVYVTHDQVEALVLSSRIAVMSDGRVMQVGTPDEIYRRPANQFVAEFVGVANLLDAVVLEHTAEETALETDAGRLWVRGASHHVAGTRLLLSIRPEAMRVHLGERLAEQNRLTGLVTSRAYHGECVQYGVSVSGTVLKVRCPANVDLAVDDKIDVSFSPDEATVVAR